MKTIFGNFTEFQQAKAAVKELEGKVPLDDINVIVQVEVAKAGMANLDWNRAMAQKSGEFAEGKIQGLDRILAGEQPINLPEVGPVLAAGSLADVIVKTSALPGATGDGLEAGLADFDLPEASAKVYVDGLKAGDVLVFVRATDNQAASVAEAFRAHQGRHIASYAGGPAPGSQA